MPKITDFVNATRANGGVDGDCTKKKKKNVLKWEIFFFQPID